MNRVCALSAGTSQTADCPFPYLAEHAEPRYRSRRIVGMGESQKV